MKFVRRVSYLDRKRIFIESHAGQRRAIGRCDSRFDESNDYGCVRVDERIAQLVDVTTRADVSQFWSDGAATPSDCVTLNAAPLSFEDLLAASDVAVGRTATAMTKAPYIRGDLSRLRLGNRAG